VTFLSNLMVAIKGWKEFPGSLFLYKWAKGFFPLVSDTFQDTSRVINVGLRRRIYFSPLAQRIRMLPPFQGASILHRSLLVSLSGI
jgi:hypothetical protein